MEDTLWRGHRSTGGADGARGCALRLQRHHDAEGNQQSFSVEFGNWEDRDEAREALEAAGVRFRTGKTLLPFRITGNIDWGVPAPELEDTKDLTVWCWPESLWAPISFTQTVLATSPEDRYSSNDWRDWWCGDDARVYQFIGQDNIYFYCIAQPAIWKALDWGLFQDTPVANYHILFMYPTVSLVRSEDPSPVESAWATSVRSAWLGSVDASTVESYATVPSGSTSVIRIVPRSSAASAATSSSPWSIMRLMLRRKVDLPQPEGPMSADTVPGAKSRLVG